jgi:DNA-binding MarR family transcriptional regulator
MNRKDKINHNDNILFLLSKAHWKMHKLLNKRFKEENAQVTPDQWLLLLNLENEGPLYQSALARAQFKDRAAIKRLIDQLEKKELVVRKRTSEDLRKKKIFLTLEGEKRITMLNKISSSTFKKASRDLSEVELNALKRLIRRIEE